MVYSDVIPLIFCCRSCRHVEPYCFSFILTLASLAGCQRYDPCAGARSFHAKPSAGFRHDAGIPRRGKAFCRDGQSVCEASMKITIWILVNRRGNSLSDRYAMWSASRLTSSLKAGYQPGAAPAWILTSITKVILTAVAEAGLSLYRINSAI